MAEHGQLGEKGDGEGLRVGELRAVVRADVSSFVPRGIDRALGAGANQAAAVGSDDDSVEQSIETPFFRSRSWAFWRVV